jgi:tRNA nucleotidyltransferase (CCA-adding enzyme)
MRIILTHEQADFDAIASLLGAYLLDESALPVLPKRMNRNVKAFLTLYGVDLPFIDRGDIPREPVVSITLVDTQSMVSVKGVSSHTQVRVVDHHQLKEGLPDDWIVTTEETGAAATLFVEGLREHNGALSMVEATLLLLGIYEDTGSLTYSRTTSRDLRAAAFLLEQGANISIANDFLNHPLSREQQAVYDQLRSTAETNIINGHIVVVSCGNAQHMDEELSTIAHKLRDTLDPDALLVFIKTRGGIQLIARSTKDNIDVSKLASHFGGGGHARASAALIKDRDLEDVCSELYKILPDFIQPAVTVAQIMSAGPQVLTPETPADEAASLMQRYGYEGFPVVHAGKVVGLLTRRAVDRALAHKKNLPEMNLTASSLMEAGKVTVSPDDSIESLQRLMTETGWGQIPVVDAKDGKIIGIVTRTDLLKTLTQASGYTGRQNLASRLKNVLPPARLALLTAIAQAAYEQRDALYIVGGFVRDLLLERPSLDFDLVVEGDAISLGRMLVKKYGGRITSHARFGTAKWFLADIRNTLVRDLRSDEPAIQGRELEPSDLPDYIDLISARTEFYTHPTALPTVQRGSIKLDLHRRDFTINTLALRLDGYHYGTLYDYWGGLNDLRQGLVRCLHSLSFVDDPTRMLRAIRFEQRFGFRIEERTLHLLTEALQLISRVSGDRIRHEIDHILDEERAVQMLARLHDLGLLKAIHPDLKWDDWIQSRISFLSDDRSLEICQDGQFQRYGSAELRRFLSYILWVIRLSPDKARRVLSRLKLSRDLAKDALSACELWKELDTLVDLPPSSATTYLEKLSTLSIKAAYLATDNNQQRELLRTYETSWSKIMPSITGHDLRARGLPPGPAYRQILDSLRSAWLDGKINSLQQEAAFLNELVTRESVDE